MSDFRAWLVGFSLIVIFIILGEFTTVFREYVYHRLGFNRNFVLTLLWLLPVVAAYCVVAFSNRRRVLKSLSLIVVLSILGPFTHFLFGKLGAQIDLAGMPGLRVTFQIYFSLSVLAIGLGTLIGVMIKRK